MVPKKVEKEVEVDLNGLLELLGAPEDFDDKLEKMLKKKERFSLILGEDLIRHPRWENLARLAALIHEYTDFEVVILPGKTNTLGVSLICDLDEEAGEFTIGYNAPGDFVLSATGDGDLDMPALNQQEGTFTNVDKRVVPTYVALPYKGYLLNDLANALGLKADLTVAYTAALPEKRGFQGFAFDDLPCHYTNEGQEIRGYALKNRKLRKIKLKVEPIAQDGALEGEVAYLCNPVLQFNAFTKKAHQIASESALLVSSEKLEKLGMKEGEKVRLRLGEDSIELPVVVDKFIGGDVLLVPDFDPAIDAEALFGATRYHNATIEKV